MIISIIVPVYNEEASLESFTTELDKVISDAKFSFEVLLIDDGSSDSSWSCIQTLCQQKEHYKGLKFSRNFGKDAAISAGLKKATGSAVIVMDADLQHPPALIPKMLRKWQENKTPIVECHKNTSVPTGVFRLFFNKLYYLLFEITTGYSIRNTSDFKLLDRAVVDAWLNLPECSPFFRGLTFWLGYPCSTIEFDVPESLRSTTRWSFAALFTLSVRSIISFSAIPLYAIPLIGVVFLFFAFLLGINALYQWFLGVAFEGFTTVILLLLITGGCILIALGIIGIYLAQIYTQVQGRPRYIIESES